MADAGVVSTLLVANDLPPQKRNGHSLLDTRRSRGDAKAEEDLAMTTPTFGQGAGGASHPVHRFGVRQLPAAYPAAFRGGGGESDAGRLR